jgi:hypothetical protein
MGVWGDVIFQLQPDLSDTPPTTRRVPIRNNQLADLGRAQAHPALKNILHLREKLVILEPQVVTGQRFECQKIT